MNYSEEEWRLQLYAERNEGSAPEETGGSEDAELYRQLFSSLGEMPDEPFLPVEDAVIAYLAQRLEKRENSNFWVSSAAVLVLGLSLTVIAAFAMNASLISQVYGLLADHWEIVLFIGVTIWAIQFIDMRLKRTDEFA